MIRRRSVPCVLIVTYASGRTEKHRYATVRQALEAEATFRRLSTVTRTQIIKAGGAAVNDDSDYDSDWNWVSIGEVFGKN